MGILDNLPDTATAKIRTQSQDSLGGVKYTYTTIWSGRSCWKQPAGANEIMDYSRRGIRVSHKVFFTQNPNVDERYILVIDGQNLKVVSRPLDDASAGLGVVWRVMVDDSLEET